MSGDNEVLGGQVAELTSLSKTAVQHFVRKLVPILSDSGYNGSYDDIAKSVGVDAKTVEVMNGLYQKAYSEVSASAPKNIEGEAEIATHNAAFRTSHAPGDILVANKTPRIEKAMVAAISENAYLVAAMVKAYNELSPAERQSSGAAIGLS